MTGHRKVGIFKDCVVAACFCTWLFVESSKMDLDIDSITDLCHDDKFVESIPEIIEAVAVHPELATSRDRCETSLLDLAAIFSSVELASALLSAGADPNDVPFGNDSPLIYAVESKSPKRYEFVSWLIQQRAIVNIAGATIESPLHAAVFRPDGDMVELLLENGADINAQYDGDDGCTPLWCACLWEQEEMVRLLLRHGADLRIRDNTAGWSPLDNAIGQGNVAIVSILLEAGADPNSRGLSSDTPLITAIKSAKRHKLDIVKLLIEEGADFNDPGDNKASPLKVASMTGDAKIVACLREYGAEEKLRHRRK